MGILVTIAVVLVLLGIAAYGIQQTAIAEPFRSLTILVLCVIAILVIGQRAGVL